MTNTTHDQSVYYNLKGGHLERILTENFAKSKVLLVVDTNTEHCCLPLLYKTFSQLENFPIVKIKPGEESKNLDNLNRIWEVLTERQFSRKDLIINIGGGVVTDLGGFAASTYKRGMAYLNIATSVLGQVDAAIGGKTGINFQGYKNLIGVTRQPLAVFISPEFLHTLPENELVSGYAEILKAGLIADKDLWNELETWKNVSVKNISSVLKTAVAIKSNVVQQDEHDLGIRKILNFGHTIGHALEAYSMQAHSQPCLHGEAVAMGMISEAYLSYKINCLPKQELDAIIHHIGRYFKKIEFSSEDFSLLLQIMRNDKKNSNGQFNFVLLNAIGKAEYDIVVPEVHVKDALEFLYHLKF